MTGKEALEKLMLGNSRFAAGEGDGAGDVDLAAMVASQSPIATVLCCSDSRVPPEHVSLMGAVYSLETGSVTILTEDGY